MMSGLPCCQIIGAWPRPSQHVHGRFRTGILRRRARLQVPATGHRNLQTLRHYRSGVGNQATMWCTPVGCWSSPHPRWLVLSSAIDVIIAATLAGCGWLMLPLPLWMLGSVLAVAIAFTFVMIKRFSVSPLENSLNGKAPNPRHGAGASRDDLASKRTIVCALIICFERRKKAA